MLKLMRLAFAMLAFLAGVGNVWSQSGKARYDQNYYSPSDAAWIRSAETNHMQRALGLMQQEIRRGAFALDGARSDLAYILDFSPNHPLALAAMTDLALRARKPEWVEPYFEKAMSLFPPHPRTLTIYGTYLQRTGRVQPAMERLQQAVRLDDGMLEAHYNLGLAYLAQKNYERANFHAQRAYYLGAPYPALRDNLKRAGAWRELPPPTPPAAAAAPAAPAEGAASEAPAKKE
jgi:Tfp pilus assembly protein PilF